MKIKTIASGSSGNCYYIEYENQILLLDAGIPIKDIKIGIDFRIADVVGCLVSHSHLDHSLSADKLENMGIRVYRPYTIEDKKILKTRIGSFNITSFDVPHNGTENRGFLINVGGKTILYMTDFEYCPYRFADMQISTMLIECNYQQTMIDEQNEHIRHIWLGHSELYTAADFIKQNTTDKLENVILCHASESGHLSKSVAVTTIKEIVPDNVNVYMAEKGLEVEL